MVVHRKDYVPRSKYLNYKGFMPAMVYRKNLNSEKLPPQQCEDNSEPKYTSSLVSGATTIAEMRVGPSGSKQVPPLVGVDIVCSV